MSLRTRNKINAQFNMSSLTDIVFLLLIFFMLTSTLVNPNALKLLLPEADGQTPATQSVTVSIDKNLDYYVNQKKVAFNDLSPALKKAVQEQVEPTVVLNVEKTVPVENLVKVMDIGRALELKMILATKPKR